MGSHGRARAAGTAACLAAIASLAIVAPPAHATTGTPTLSLSLTRSNHVKVAWTFSAKLRHAIPMQIQRATDGATYTTVLDLTHVRESSSRLDKHAPTAKLWYRACLMTDPRSCSPAATIDHGTATSEGGETAKYGNCGSASGIGNLIALVNVDREKVGAPPLREDARLDAAALAHSRKHVKNHTDPGGEIAAAGYHATAWGQNIGWGYRTAAQFEGDLFAEGPGGGHYRNIVNRAYTAIGVACDDNYWTEDFAAGG